MTMVQAGHLGGYVPGGDEATIYPDLWRWLVEGPLSVRTVVDVGCGDGVAVRAFRDLGCLVRGVDGVPQDDTDIIEHDYTKGPLGADSGRFMHAYQLVWSCEFVEHVEERYLPNFLATFKVGMYVLMTHADPGQPGWHHVNCRPADYWVGALAAAGFSLDPDLTATTRQLAAANPSPWNHYRRSGLAFVRNPPG